LGRPVARSSHRRGPANGSTTPGTQSTTDFRQFSNRTFWQIALRADIDVTPDITLTSMTSYDHFDQTQRTGGDGNDIVTFDLQRSDGRLRTFNQELRLANSGHGALKWIVGGNYERSVTEEDQLLRFFDNTAYNAGNLYINGSAVENHQKITNWAIFGNAEYKLIDRVTADRRHSLYQLAQHRQQLRQHDHRRQ
jgi:hypothetical protein